MPCLPRLKALSVKQQEYYGLEVFSAPEKITSVVLSSKEVTALCPVTNQPDWYSVEISYVPNKVCIESKSLKLFLHSFRNKGIFCEMLADHILGEIVNVTKCNCARVTVTQSPRGGVSIVAVAEIKYKDV